MYMYGFVMQTVVSSTCSTEKQESRSQPHLFVLITKAIKDL